jgi:hypothetical protein
MSEPTAVEPEPAADTFGFGGFASSEPVAEPPATPTEESASPFSGPDFSGMSVSDEPSAPPVKTAPPAEDESGFSGPAFDGPPPSDTSIEGLTQKLQTAKKITPVIDFSSKASSDSTDNTLATSGFVTPTLAEIYAKQGWFDDAIKAYRALAKTKPAEREKYEARIAELEEEKKKQG